MKVSPPRFQPHQPFPPYAYHPGRHPHPQLAGGYRFNRSEPFTSRIQEDHPHLNADFGFGLDLFNYAYYWESHVYFEALWKAHHREGQIADFLKILIHLAAANLRAQENQLDRADRHLQRALALLTSLLFDFETHAESKKKTKHFLGFDLLVLQTKISQQIMGSETGAVFFGSPLIPHWRP